MPCRFIIDRDRGLIVTTGWDRVTFPEMKAHQEKLFNDPEFDPRYNQLVDGTAVTAVEASPDQLKSIFDRQFFSPTSRRAFLATSLAILSAARIIEMYAGLTRGREEVRVFHDRQAAMEWLGIADRASR
jgi:hypothetical protein